MRLTVVGCSGSYPGPDSPASCYLLEADDTAGRSWRILLDLGNGALGALHRHADPLSIDGVVLSHLHADHCLDLCGYYVLRKYHPGGPQPPIPVWGPLGTAERLARAYDLPADPGMTAEFDFHAFDGPFALGPFVIDPTPVSHPVAAFALRVTAGGRTLVYSGDSGVCAGLARAAARADLFLVEASFVDDERNPPDLHLTGREAGEVAAGAGVGQVLLTHIPPWHDPARALKDAQSTYAGPIELAVAGASYDV
jgi:ribonuclease BN (tRNA processing enzyme)